ncbi:MAG: family 16 glycoside hydrolase [Pseudomonadota bacterium]
MCYQSAFRFATVLAFLAVSINPLLAQSPDNAPPLPSDARLIDFEGEAPSSVPDAFAPGLTGRGPPARWQIQDDDDAASGRRVITQLSKKRISARYPLLVLQDFAARDVDISVKLKTVSGNIDASGGLIFRFVDERNYYVVRANSLEGNVVAYRTKNGRRRHIGVVGNRHQYGVDAPVTHRDWVTLRVIARGPRFEIFLDGKRAFDVENRTFAGSGQIGLWTKADAVTQFDDLIVRSLD